VSSTAAWERVWERAARVAALLAVVVVVVVVVEVEVVGKGEGAAKWKGLGGAPRATCLSPSWSR